MNLWSKVRTLLVPSSRPGCLKNTLQVYLFKVPFSLPLVNHEFIFSPQVLSGREGQAVGKGYYAKWSYNIGTFTVSKAYFMFLIKSLLPIIGTSSEYNKSTPQNIRDSAPPTWGIRSHLESTLGVEVWSSVSDAVSMVPRCWDIGPTIPMGPSPRPSLKVRSYGHLHEGWPLYIQSYILLKI